MPKYKKLLILPTPPLFEAPALGNPLECQDEILHQKTRITGLPDGEEITIPPRDRRTDGQTDRHVTIAITRASIASLG